MSYPSTSVYRNFGSNPKYLMSIDAARLPMVVGLEAHLLAHSR